MDGAKSNRYHDYGTAINLTRKSSWAMSRLTGNTSIKVNTKSGHNEMIVLQGLSLSISLCWN